MNILRPLSPHLARFRKWFYCFLIFFILLSFCYYFFPIIHFDFPILWLKIKSMLLRKSLYYLLNRLGWAGGILSAVLLAVDLETAPPAGNMMLPSGEVRAQSFLFRQAPHRPYPQAGATLGLRSFLVPNRPPLPLLLAWGPKNPNSPRQNK